MCCKLLLCAAGMITRAFTTQAKFVFGSMVSFLLLSWTADEFPAFFTPHSGCQAPCRIEQPAEAAQMLLHCKALDLQSGILIGKGCTAAALVETEWDSCRLASFFPKTICNVSHQPCLQGSCDTSMLVHALWC